MLALITHSGALADPITHPDPTYVIAVGSDPHEDFDAYSTPSMLTATGTFYGAAAAAMDADATLLLGDLFGARKSDLDGDRVWDCVVDRRWSTTCEYPSDWLGQRYATARAQFAGPAWALGGNHDGHPPLPSIASLSQPNEWWIRWIDPLNQPGVVGGAYTSVAHQLIRVEMPGGTWDLLLLHDLTWTMDRAQGGRCDLRDYDGLESLRLGCSTLGWPNGVVSEEQAIWVEAQIAAAALATPPRKVLIATHAPPANTVTLSTPGSAYVQACAGTPGTQAPVYVQAPSMGHFPRDADFLPNRTDLDEPIPNDPSGLTPLEAAHRNVGNLVRWPLNGTIDTEWGLRMVRRYPGVVKLWVSGHNHLPVPDLVDSVGRGVRYDDSESGTTFLAHGALTRFWVTTSGSGRPQAARLELHADGSWAWQRWSLQLSTQATGLWTLGCATNAALPATRPAPWVGLPIETGQ